MIHSRPPPKVYHLLIKTHKTTVFVTTAPTASVASVKSEVFSALTSDVNKDTETPEVSSEDDFDLCKPFKDKGKPTGAYEVVDTSLQVKQAGINNWEHLFIKFHDAESGMCYIHPRAVHGKPLPITYTKPSFDGDEHEEVVEWHEDEDEAMMVDIPSSSSVRKGKRKAPSE
ncbi:hypothetical protein EYR36_006566 [Pleurotus pulmonarius]|nr:hypothetical protein EYR36_006566 [Pleurotus pulmonarius]KAF4601265.1 hypothetical protein EYR38_005917 [Pleurotus pulmonarius]